MRSTIFLFPFLLVLAACGDDSSSTDTATPSAGAGGAGAGGAGGAGAGGSPAGAGGAGAGGSPAGAGGAGVGGAGAGAGGAGAGGAGAGGAGAGGAGAGGAGAGGGGEGGEGGAGGAGQAGAAGEGGAGGAAGLTLEQWGARARGVALAVRRSGRTLWMGSRAIADIDSGKLRGGLTRLDLDTGEVRIFESELPEAVYEEGKGPMATADALDDGERTLALAQGGVLVREAGAFKLQPLGSGGVPLSMALDRAGGRKRLWVGSSAGLHRLDADSLAQEKLYAAADLGGEVGHLAVDPATGAVFAVIYGSSGSRAARVDGDQIASLVPGKDGVDEGKLGEVVYSAKAGGALFALGAWQASKGGVLRWDGKEAKLLVTEGQLAKAATGEHGAFGAAALALDDEGGLLLVGGQIQPSGPLGGLLGGGLAWVELATGKLAGLSTGRDGLPGDHVASLAYDPASKRAYAALRQPCNELKLGNKGLVAISFKDGKTPRYERPILSGVRSLIQHGGRMLVGLRDDAPGLSCDGHPIQTGLYELHSNRSGELVSLQSAPEAGLIPFDAGPTALASDGARLAVGTFRDGDLIGDPGGGFFFNPTQYGPSLYTLDVAFQGDALWVTGRSTHDPGDPPSLADVGPYGAAKLLLSGDKITGSLHYARAAKNPGPVVGLPSSEVVAALPRPDGSALLICATERSSVAPSDRAARAVFTLNGEAREGGVALVNDKSVSTLTQPGDAPDPRAAALLADGSLVLLDATKGALRLIDGKVEAFALPLPPPEGAAPQSLWVSPAGLVAGYDRGAVLKLGDAAKLIDGVGFVWRALERGSGVVLLGTDEGLVRARTAPQDIAEGAPGAAVLPAFSAIEPVGSGGQCLGKGEVCQGKPDGCCPGLSCGGGGIVLTCN